MELASLALQESQHFIITWQTPLLFLLVQLLVVLIYFNDNTFKQQQEEEELQQQQDFWSSAPSQLTSLPSPLVTCSRTSSLAGAAALVVGLRKWARRAASHSHTSEHPAIMSIL